MKLSDITKDAVFGTIATITGPESVEKAYSFIQHNLPVLKLFDTVLLSINWSSSDKIVYEYCQLWYTYHPNVKVLRHEVNKGHTFGTMELDNSILNECKKLNKNFLFKSSEDMLLKYEAFNAELPKSDFYYLNGIGKAGVDDYKSDYQKIISEEFYPQTNFYIINVNKVDYLNNKKLVEDNFNFLINIPNYNNKPWEYFYKFSCEYLLQDCVLRNKLSKCHLISDTTYLKLLKFIDQNNVHDGSHKNIMLDNFCHYHFYNSPVITI